MFPNTNEQKVLKIHFPSFALVFSSLVSHSFLYMVLPDLVKSLAFGAAASVLPTQHLPHGHCCAPKVAKAVCGTAVHTHIAPSFLERRNSKFA